LGEAWKVEEKYCPKEVIHRAVEEALEVAFHQVVEEAVVEVALHQVVEEAVVVEVQAGR